MKVEMLEISKSFGSHEVLQKVDFEITGGEVCALLGENGAGKSTLMNILGGLYQDYKGKIMIDGQEVKFKIPRDSLEQGIAFIHQELNLINDLSIYENLFLGRELKTRYHLLDRKQMIAKTNALFKRMGITLSPTLQVSTLDTAYKQFVEIAKALMMDAKIIVMDEPTTSLTKKEIDRVFEMIEVLKKQNVGIVFISHKLMEVKQICTKYIILRDGKRIMGGAVIDQSVEKLSMYMVGNPIDTKHKQRNQYIGEEVLRVEHLSNKQHFHSISFKLHKGEILGVTGLLGDGRSELFRAVFGDLPYQEGTIYIEGKKVTITSIQQAIKEGVGYVPSNRKENGTIKDLSIIDNGTLITLNQIRNRSMIDTHVQKICFNEQRKALKIKMQKENDLITQLSGGNQQKVVLAKWLLSKPKLLILDNPTQGVDVGAKEEIYEILMKLAEEGVGVIVLSSELQEIIRLCSRVMVMNRGRIVGELLEDEMTEQAMMYLATSGYTCQ